MRASRIRCDEGGSQDRNLVAAVPVAVGDRRSTGHPAAVASRAVRSPDRQHPAARARTRVRDVLGEAGGSAAASNLTDPASDDADSGALSRGAHRSGVDGGHRLGAELHVGIAGLLGLLGCFRGLPGRRLLAVRLRSAVTRANVDVVGSWGQTRDAIRASPPQWG
jgi:hypothetical protein